MVLEQNKKQNINWLYQNCLTIIAIRIHSIRLTDVITCLSLVLSLIGEISRRNRSCYHVEFHKFFL